MCGFWKVSVKEGRYVCPSSFLLAGLQRDRRCLSRQPGPRGREPYIQDDGAAKQKKTQSSWNCRILLACTLLLSAGEIKFYLAWGTSTLVGFFLFVLLLFLPLTAKPNLNWSFPISIIYVFICDIRTALLLMWQATYEWGTDSSVFPS